MAGFKHLRNRIETVKSTCKITSAMKLVAASRLRKSQGLIEKCQFYNHNILASANRIIYEMREEEKSSGISYIYPDLMKINPDAKTYLLVLFTSDRGLCGNFNSSNAKEAIARIEALQSEGKNVQVFCIGKRGKDILKRKYGHLILETYEGIAKKGAKYFESTDIALKILDMYKNKTIDICEIISPKFYSVMNREIKSRQALPIMVEEFEYNKLRLPTSIVHGAFYDYEPNKLEILEGLLPLIFKGSLFQAVVHSQASEHGARMTSMDNATRNAKDMISSLTLKYNGLRQTAITTELIEIISGAEAL